MPPASGPRQLSCHRLSIAAYIAADIGVRTLVRPTSTHQQQRGQQQRRAPGMPVGVSCGVARAALQQQRPHHQHRGEGPSACKWHRRAAGARGVMRRRWRVAAAGGGKCCKQRGGTQQLACPTTPHARARCRAAAAAVRDDSPPLHLVGGHDAQPAGRGGQAVQDHGPHRPGHPAQGGRQGRDWAGGGRAWCAAGAGGQAGPDGSLRGRECAWARRHRGRAPSPLRHPSALPRPPARL